jgi:protein disulfide-isomerase A6
VESVESWIDAIRLSEGVKKKLPEGVVAISVEEPASAAAPEEAASEPTIPDATDATNAENSEEATAATPEPSGDEAADSTESTATQAADPTGEPETAHDEL